ncbi:MAG: hypothetical protein IPK83_08320 [Planctomycetes bacterium]|nr:hypothetical protein [Planctomycetota bacterium]
MPGLSLWITPSDAPQAAVRFRAALDARKFSPRDQTSIVHTAEGLFVGHTGRPTYPVQTITAGARTITLEGRIYRDDVAAVLDDLRALADALFAGDTLPRDRLAAWTRANEGEYVVAMLDPTARRAIVFADPFTRLPLYWHRSDAGVIISRECDVVVRLSAARQFDRLAWAQALVFRHLIGARTFWEGIDHAPGGAVFDVRLDGSRVKAALHTTYSIQLRRERRPRHIRRRLCRRTPRASGPNTAARSLLPALPGKRILSLSGGKDSRVVAGLFAREKIPCVAATYLDAHGVASADAVAAESLAAALNIPWRLYRLGQPSPDAEQFLLRALSGTNSIAHGSLLLFLEQLVSDWGDDAIYITGDGGDFIFPDLRPAESLTIDQYVAGLLRPHNKATPVREAESIMRLPPGALESSLRDRLNSYPEKSVAQKAVHFRRYDRGMNWLFPGEDRARFFLWQTSPFNYFSIFERTMRVPDAVKSRDALYVAFLRKVSPQAAAVVEAGLGVPMSSPIRSLKYRLKRLAMSLPVPMTETIRRMIKGRRPPFAMPTDCKAVIDAKFASDDGFGELVDRAALERRLPHMSRLEFENLWTLVLLHQMYMERAG